MSILFNDVTFDNDKDEAFDLYADMKESARTSALVDELQENDWDEQDDFETMG